MSLVQDFPMRWIRDWVLRTFTFGLLSFVFLDFNQTDFVDGIDQRLNHFMLQHLQFSLHKRRVSVKKEITKLRFIIQVIESGPYLSSNFFGILLELCLEIRPYVNKVCYIGYSGQVCSTSTFRRTFDFSLCSLFLNFYQSILLLRVVFISNLII